MAFLGCRLGVVRDVLFPRVHASVYGVGFITPYFAGLPGLHLQRLAQAESQTFSPTTLIALLPPSAPFLRPLAISLINC